VPARHVTRSGPGSSFRRWEVRTAPAGFGQRLNRPRAGTQTLPAFRTTHDEKAMNRRIHDHLDGALDRDTLTPAEAAEAAAADALVRRAGDVLRAVPVPDLTARVAARVEALRPAPSPLAALAERTRAAAAWLLAPQTLRVRPAFGFAAAALMAVVLALPFAGGTGERADAGATDVQEPAAVLVQFRIDAPHARSVSLAGSFTGWEATIQLYEAAPGVWTARVPVAPGIHDYLFMVDGEWTEDPVAPAVPDGFGGSNSRLLLPTGAAST
jgi:hypothetical protein